MIPNQQDQIDSYLSGRMTAEEAARFDASLQANPELRQEVAFQSEVVQGIQHYRKAQIKARLDAVQVSAGWWGAVQQSSVLQWVGGVVAVSLISAGVFWFVSQPTEEEVPAKQVKEEKPEVISESNIEQVPSVPSATTVDEDISTDEKFEQRNTPPVAEEVTVEETEAVANRGTEAKEPFNPKVKVPQVEDVEAERTFQAEKLPTPEVADQVENKEEPLDVEVVDMRGSKVKYRYYAGKLYLYGQFANTPYEILEINSAEGRRVYLYHADTYYELLPSDKTTGALPVTDQKLLNDLSILRKAN